MGLTIYTDERLSTNIFSKEKEEEEEKRKKNPTNRTLKIKKKFELHFLKENKFVDKVICIFDFFLCSTLNKGHFNQKIKHK